MANETLHAPAIEAVAMAKHVRMSPQKVRLVVDLIRGQRAEDALQILRFTKKRATRDVEKVLRSAIANAERKAEEIAPAAEGPPVPAPAPPQPHCCRRPRASPRRAAARRCRSRRSGVAEG